MTTLTLAAPAKLNLFLHVTGRRGDGYHTLESLFVLIDLADTIELAERDDDALVRSADIAGVSEQRLSLIAAKIEQVPCVLRAFWSRG